MKLATLIDDVREHYIDQFESFVDGQTAACNRGAAEVKFMIPGPTPLYRAMVCMDFVKSDNGGELIRFDPPYQLEFDRFIENIGSVQIAVESLRWDNVVLHHDAPRALSLDAWFERWFDPEDQRHAERSKLGRVIHSLALSGTEISIDFGTAPVEAFWELLAELDQAGVRRIKLNCGSATSH